MKNKISIIIPACLLCLFYYGCKKDIFSASSSSRQLTDSDRVETSKKAIESKYAGYLKEKAGKLSLNWMPDWKSTTFLKKNDSVNLVYIPLKLEIVDSVSKRKFEDVRSSKSRRFIVATFSANDAVSYQIGTYISAQSSSAFNNDFRKFSGNVIYKDIDGKNVLRQLYVDGKPGIEKRPQVNSKLSVNNTECRYFYSCFYVSYNESAGCAPRYEIVGGYDSCSEPDPSSGGCYYVFRLVSTDVQSECSTTTNPNYPPPPPTGGGGGGTGTGAGNGSDAVAFTEDQWEHAKIINDDRRKPINPVNYINCFTDGKQASGYKMTFYVDQPVHGQRDQFVFLPNSNFSTATGNPMYLGNQIIDVGHTFVMFEKTNTDGTSVKQLFGFYPGGFTAYSKGVIKDDSGHPYDVSYTFPVGAEQFQDALNRVISDSETATYELFKSSDHSEYNCTDAALDWVITTGNYQIPFAPRGFFDNTPGDCGAALYNSNLNVNRTAGNAPIGKGPCN